MVLSDCEANSECHCANDRQCDRQVRALDSDGSGEVRRADKAHALQHADPSTKCDEQQSTCNLQCHHARRNMRHAIINRQHTTCKVHQYCADGSFVHLQVPLHDEDWPDQVPPPTPLPTSASASPPPLPQPLPHLRLRLFPALPPTIPRPASAPPPPGPCNCISRSVSHGVC